MSTKIKTASGWKTVANNSNGRTEYSTSEVFTGSTWIDGKKIYRKVIQFNNTSPSTSWSNYPFTKPTNMENAVYVQCIRLKTPTDATAGLNDGISINFNSGQWIATGNVIACNAIVLEYTKSTD